MVSLEMLKKGFTKEIEDYAAIKNTDATEFAKKMSMRIKLQKSSLPQAEYENLRQHIINTLENKNLIDVKVEFEKSTKLATKVH